MQDVIHMSLEEMVKATETGITGLSLKNRNGRMLVQLFRQEAMQSLAGCVRRCVLMERKSIYNGYIRMKFVKSESANRGVCPISRDYTECGIELVFLRLDLVCCMNKERMFLMNLVL